MRKFSHKEADSILARLDKVASAIQANHAKWGMPFKIAKQIVNDLDRTADEIEIASFGQESFEARQAEEVVGFRGRQAEVLQRESDEPYMTTFENPMSPIQTESDEPYMQAYADDQSSAVIHGVDVTGRHLAPGHK